MTELFENREYYDTLIYASNSHEQPVHKCIVFKQIPKLENIDTKEIKYSDKNYEEPYYPIIYFHNETFKVLRDLVEFVYLNEINGEIHDNLALLDLAVRLEYTKLVDYILSGISPDNFKDNDEIVEFVSKLSKIKGISDKIKEKIKELFIDKKYRIDLDNLNDIDEKEIMKILESGGNLYHCGQVGHTKLRDVMGWSELNFYYLILEDKIKNLKEDELYLVPRAPLKLSSINFLSCNCGIFGTVNSSRWLKRWRFYSKKQLLKKYPEFEDIIPEKVFTSTTIFGKKIFTVSGAGINCYSRAYNKVYEIIDLQSKDLTMFSKKYLKSLGYY